MEHVGIVKRTASHLANRLPAQVERSELIGVGVLKLIDAAGRFNRNMGVPFGAFARRRIHGAMLDSLRADDSAPRAVRHDTGMAHREFSEIWDKFLSLNSLISVLLTEAARGYGTRRLGSAKVSTPSADGSLGMQDGGGRPAGAQPASADKVARAKALLESGELGADSERLAKAIIDRTLGQYGARRISLMTEFAPPAAVGRPRASLDTVARALANVYLDGLQAAEGDLAAAVGELALDPRLRRDRPSVEPAK